MSEDELDLSFLEEELEPTEKLNCLLQDLKTKLDKMTSDLQRQDREMFEEINRKLATGKCFFDSKENAVLMYKEEDGEPEAIWFPKGNALEWQLERGLISEEYFNTMKELEAQVEKMKKDKPTQ